MIKNVSAGAWFTRCSSTSFRALQPCFIVWSTYKRKKKSLEGKFLQTQHCAKTYQKVVIRYLCLKIVVSLAYHSCDFGKGKLVPEVLIPTQGLGFVQQSQSLGIVLLFTSQTGQIDQTSWYNTLVSKHLNRNSLNQKLNQL